MVLEVQRIAQKYDVQICTFGHAGDGNLHPTAMTDARDPEEIHRVEEAFAEIFEVDCHGGTITGEHGVGIVKALPGMEGGQSRHPNDEIHKDAIDPHQIMNPGKLFAETRKRIVFQERTEQAERGSISDQDQKIETS